MRIIRKFIESNFLEELYEDSTLACEKLRFKEFKHEDDEQEISECYDEIRATLFKLESLAVRLKSSIDKSL